MSTSSDEDTMLLVLLLKKKQRRRQRKRWEARRRHMNLGTQEPELATEVNAEQNDGIKTENDPLLGEYTAEGEYNQTVNRLESVLNDAQQVYEELKQCIENHPEDADTDNNIKEEIVEDENENNTNTNDNVYLNIYTQDDTPVLYQNGHIQYVNNLQYQTYPQYFVVKQEPPEQ